MSTPSPPSLYERFLDGITDIEKPGERQPGTVSPPRSPITLANPLNKFHIPRVPASGINVQPIGTPSTENIGNEGNSKGKGKATHTEPTGSMSQRESDNQSKMSQAARETLQKVRQMIPPMLEKFHKGQMGRVAVIGGSEDYTGAPYFSAMASARLGADMSHVICEPQAAQVIKSYSPNLMVHPLMRQSTHASSTDTASSIAAAITALLPRFHVLVIGPGLGRDPLMQDVCARVIVSAKASHMPFVLDADGLLLAQTRPELVQGYRECILTPNLAEFARLCMAQGLDPLKFAPETGEGAEALARKLGGVTVVQKGRRDWISNGELTVLNDVEGGFKRSGGQGDTLTGSLATFLAWRKAYLDGIWEHDGSLDRWELLALAAFGGSAITRECSRLAFAKQGRSLQASDLTEEVAVAFRNLFEEGTGADAKL